MQRRPCFCTMTVHFFCKAAFFCYYKEIDAGHVSEIALCPHHRVPLGPPHKGKDRITYYNHVICLLHIFQALSVIGSCDLYIQTFGWPNENVFFFFDYEFIFSGDHLLLQKPSLRASSPGRSGAAVEKGRRACNYVSGIWVSASKKSKRNADWRR